FLRSGNAGLSGDIAPRSWHTHARPRRIRGEEPISTAPRALAECKPGRSVGAFVAAVASAVWQEPQERGLRRRRAKERGKGSHERRGVRSQFRAARHLRILSGRSGSIDGAMARTCAVLKHPVRGYSPPSL